MWLLNLEHALHYFMVDFEPNVWKWNISKTLFGKITKMFLTLCKYMTYKIIKYTFRNNKQTRAYFFIDVYRINASVVITIIKNTKSSIKMLILLRSMLFLIRTV